MLFDKFKKERYMIVGLGNPGAKYDKTRHNAGFMALDILEEEFGAKPFGNQKNATLTRANFEGLEVIFVRPLTFMNLSGRAVNEVGSYYKIPPERIIAIADDISMEVGRMRIRDKGSDGGHNGLKDILRVLGNQNLMRIKIGVGQKPHPDYDLADWVLSKFTKEDLEKLKPVLESVPGAVKLLLRGDLSAAQNRFNR
ncbi:MAG: aminoacyl-tRNA hydrolase [Clostridia bacterium]|nr:aminoacyl-tRNA hydrolase [Clostridia bacterium]